MKTLAFRLKKNRSNNAAQYPQQNRRKDYYKESCKEIKKSFQENVARVWLHTCSLDHKHALKNYLSRGMKIFKSEIVKI